FAGTWELDKTKSQNLPRSWQDATSVNLTITQNEKQLILETKVVNPTSATPAGPGGPGGGRGFGGMMGPTTYNLDGSEITSEGERGKSTTKAVWSKDGSTLELSVTRTFTTPNGEVTATTTDKLTLSGDGKVLTDTRHSEGPRGPQDSTLVYSRK
ncbi:MAG TPA: hypothetical protein VIV66_22595, partial [Pyrinomonadaceae bacterium]